MADSVKPKQVTCNPATSRGLVGSSRVTRPLVAESQHNLPSVWDSSRGYRRLDYVPILESGTEVAPSASDATSRPGYTQVECLNPTVTKVLGPRDPQRRDVSVGDDFPTVSTTSFGDVVDLAEKISPGISGRINIKDFDAISSAVLLVTRGDPDIVSTISDRLLRSSPKLYSETVAQPRADLLTIRHEASVPPSNLSGPSSRTDATRAAPKRAARIQPAAAGGPAVPPKGAAKKVAVKSKTKAGKEKEGEVRAVKGGTKSKVSSPKPAAKPLGMVSDPKNSSAPLVGLRQRIHKKMWRSFQTKLADNMTLSESLSVTREDVQSFLDSKSEQDLISWGPSNEADTTSYLESSGFLDRVEFSHKWSDSVAISEWHDNYLRRKILRERRSKVPSKSLNKVVRTALSGVPGDLETIASRLSGLSVQTMQNALSVPGIGKFYSPPTVRLSRGPKAKGSGHWARGVFIFSAETMKSIHVPDTHPSYLGNSRFRFFLTSAPKEDGSGSELVIATTSRNFESVQGASDPVVWSTKAEMGASAPRLAMSGSETAEVPGGST